MNFKNPLIRVPLKYGLVGGALSIFLFVLLYLLGKNPLIVYRGFDFSFLLLPIFIAFSMKEFRDRWNGKTLKFGEGMTVGFINYMTIAIVSALFTYIFLSVIDPDLLTGYIVDRSSMLMEMKSEMVDNLGEKVFEQTLGNIRESTAYIIALDDFLKKIIIGLFLTIIISVIFKKQSQTS